jgi:hypothetical protein
MLLERSDQLALLAGLLASAAERSEGRLVLGLVAQGLRNGEIAERLSSRKSAARNGLPAGSGAAFTFWHPRLVTLHVWRWYPNPKGLYASTNPFVAPFTDS